MTRIFSLRLSDEAAAYFESCARIRDVMPGPLVSEMLELISRDVLLGAILDDGEQLKRKKVSGGRGFERHHYRQTKRKAAVCPEP